MVGQHGAVETTVKSLHEPAHLARKHVVRRPPDPSGAGKAPRTPRRQNVPWHERRRAHRARRARPAEVPTLRRERIPHGEDATWIVLKIDALNSSAHVPSSETITL